MVEFSSPLPADTRVTILGTTPPERAVDYNNYVTLKAAAMNLDANYQEAQIQENSRQLKRALLTPPTDGIPENPMTLPPEGERKNSYLAFDGECMHHALLGNPWTENFGRLWEQQYRQRGIRLRFTNFGENRWLT
jgi:hypothetical protein